LASFLSYFFPPSDTESVVYVISQLFFWGGGREIAQEGDKILQKVSLKL